MQSTFFLLSSSFDFVYDSSRKDELVVVVVAVVVVVVVVSLCVVPFSCSGRS